jgi:TPP-dependent 2-oxoacid decarboxylase
MTDLLAKLAQKTPVKSQSLTTFQRLADSNDKKDEPPKHRNDTPLLNKELRAIVQENITSETDLVIETGDSWFIGQNFKLPDGAGYHVQMQYGSIGWSVGAALGVGYNATKTGRRLIAMIGDGSFQLTCQEVSTMIRYNITATIIVINNNGYTIEVEIHDGPYNDIQQWDYAKIIEVFNGDNKGEFNTQKHQGLGIKARTSAEFAEAMTTANNREGVTLIEVFLDRNDCTSQLLLWGSNVAAANGRP